MNITLSADSKTIEEAREWAKSQGTSINSLVREYLASLGKKIDRQTAAELFVETARNKSGRSNPETSFSRDSLYTGKRFGGQDE